MKLIIIGAVVITAGVYALINEFSSWCDDCIPQEWEDESKN